MAVGYVLNLRLVNQLHFDMAKFLRCFLLAVLKITCLLYAQEYSIIRRADSYDYDNHIWKITPDLFTIDSSDCDGDGSKQCSDMGGRKRRRVNCSCACNFKSNNNILISSTFGFYDNTWKCHDNTKVRTHGGRHMELFLYCF